MIYPLTWEDAIGKFASRGIAKFGLNVERLTPSEAFELADKRPAIGMIIASRGWFASSKAPDDIEPVVLGRFWTIADMQLIAGGSFLRRELDDLIKYHKPDAVTISTRASATDVRRIVKDIGNYFERGTMPGLILSACIRDYYDNDGREEAITRERLAIAHKYKKIGMAVMGAAQYVATADRVLARRVPMIATDVRLDSAKASPSAGSNTGLTVNQAFIRGASAVILNAEWTPEDVSLMDRYAPVGED